MSRYVRAIVGATGVTATVLAAWKACLLIAEAVQYNLWILAGGAIWLVCFFAAVRGSKLRG